MALPPSILDPSFPAEIEREIFEISALSHPGSIPTLILVSRRVKVWIEPRLYTITSVYADQDLDYKSKHAIAPHIFLAMVDSKSRSFWHDHVRHLSILTSLEEDDVVKVLSTCSGVSNLALFQGDLRPAYLPLLAAMPLVRLATDLGAMFGFGQEIDFGHALFKNITHLDISDTHAPDDGSWPVGFGRLPCLTHLSFNFPGSWHHVDRYRPFFQGILAHCALLRVFVLISTSDKGVSDSLQHFYYFKEDPRAVLLPVNDYLRDWEIGAEGGTDYWVIAENFVQKRHSAVIKASNFAIISSAD